MPNSVDEPDEASDQQETQDSPGGRPVHAGTDIDRTAQRKYQVLDADATNRQWRVAESRYRARPDGGRDETFRLHFKEPVTPATMQTVIDLLAEVSKEGADLGIIALTKVDFLSPDVCEYRFWCTQPPLGTRLDKMYALWRQINAIQSIHDVDGVVYPWLDGSAARAEPQ